MDDVINSLLLNRSFGVVLWELLTCEVPYKVSFIDIVDVVVNGCLYC